VNPSIESIDWHGFLQREPLPCVSAEGVGELGRGPVLITGAGGSIGSAVAVRLAGVGTELILLEASESGLHELQSRMDECSEAGKQSFYLGSGADRGLLKEIFARHKPGVVFHTAAFKHVPLLEEQPLAAIANNVFGTQMLAGVAAEHDARVVLLSTDKAVAARSVMGATKRVAEKIVLASGGIVVRLANVLGSRGSVSEVFAQQIATGRSLTVTDALAERYFLTLGEAVELLIGAAAIGDCAIVVPLLKKAHRIAELAEFMGRTLAPEREVAIEFTGLRAGEKLREQLWAGDEDGSEDAARGRVGIAAQNPSRSWLEGRLRALEENVTRRDVANAITSLRELVPDYEPSATVLALVKDSAVVS
jgi:FlaA1/EpsC-like NDP-sugar epimerase